MSRERTRDLAADELSIGTSEDLKVGQKVFAIASATTGALWRAT